MGMTTEIVVSQQVEGGSDISTFSTFRPQADLRPQILEKEATYKEALHFQEIFANYLSNGYGGKARIPQQMIAVQLQPFINPIWWSQMIAKQVKEKDLEGAISVILEVASDNNPVHGRRMDLLKLRRGSMDHRTFLFKLEELMELTMYHEWSKEKMIIHLFLEGADTEMARIATNMLAKDTVSLPDLIYEVRATENSTWYKRPLQVKYTQEKDNWETEGLGGSGGQPGGVRWCGDCKSKTHTPETCWGVCQFCSKRGHKKEDCRNKPSEDTGAAKLTKKQEKRKKEKAKKKEKMKLLKEAAMAAQSSDLNLTPNNSVGSSSEIDSPHMMDQRSARIYPQGIAKRCTFNLEEQRMMKLNAEMEKEMDMSAVLNAKSARGKLSPILQGQIYKKRGDTFYKIENMLADTGCSYNICGEQIIRDLGIRIFPFRNKMQILDASGNYLKLIGSAVLYVRTQVLGLKTVKRLEVAVQDLHFV